MADNYGLNISNNLGRYICNGSNPLFTVVGSFATSIVPGTEGTPVSGYYSVWANSSLIKAEYSPTLLLPCNTGYTSPYCVGEGFAAFITSSPNGQNIKICSPSGFAPPSVGLYGLESYDSGGNRIFSSVTEQVIIRDIVSIDVSSIDSAVISGGVVSKSHVYVENPLYIIDGLQYSVVQFERYSYLNVYQSYYIFAKAGIINTSKSSFNVRYTYLAACSQQGSNSQAWGCYKAASEFVSSYGGMTNIYARATNIYAGALYRYAPSSTLTVLVCETK